MDETIQNTCATFVADDLYTLEEITQLANISKSSLAQIMKKLEYSYMRAWWVLHLLTSKQKAKHVEICSLWVECLEENLLYFESVITTNDMWVHLYDL